MQKSDNSLATRIKRYEETSRFVGTQRMPMIIRVDGKAFHTFTKNCRKPFDVALIEAMRGSAREVSKEMQGFKAAYVQSDEATFLLTDYDHLATQGWFGYVYAKMISISAASMSVHFNSLYSQYNCNTSRAIFDSRAFNVPIEDVANVFLWRAKDWQRNSLQMYAQSFFTHKQLHGKNTANMHNMLHDIGKNWTTCLSDVERNGTFISRDGEFVSTVHPVYQEIYQFISENL